MNTEGISVFPAVISFTRPVTAMFNERRRAQAEQRFVSPQITEASLAISMSCASTAADDCRWSFS